MTNKKPPHPKRKPGAWKGKVWISPDFDKPDPELEALFYDSPIEPDGLSPDVLTP
jgi:hypothetical protein